MSLRIALFLSVLLHAMAVGVPLPGGAVTEPPRPAGQQRLVFRLVDPATALGAETPGNGATPASMAPTQEAREDAAAGGASSGGPSPAAVPRTAAPASDLTETDPVGMALTDRTAEPDPAADVVRPAATPAAVPARRGRGPTLAEMEAELGLDLTDVVEQGQDQIFPVMLKVHLAGGRPNASTYRQLLRTYIDVLMGYPWAVQAALARNADVRFLAMLQVEIDADGAFRIANLLINENVADADGRIEGFYRRLLDEVSSRPFLPPARAGIDAPALLTFQILNPEATR